MRLEDVVATGDRLVVRYLITSTCRGGYLGLPAGGQQVREEGIVIFHLHDRRVAELWFQGNDLQIAEQLGGRIMAPDPATARTRPPPPQPPLPDTATASEPDAE